MSYTRCIYYIFILGHFAESLCGSAEKLTKEEFSALLPQRNKVKDVENHFPNQPELPDSITDKEIFYLISNANDSYDEEIMAKDALALPLGAQESDFNPVTYNQNNQGDDDAVIIEAGGTNTYHHGFKYFLKSHFYSQLIYVIIMCEQFELRHLLIKRNIRWKHKFTK